MGRWRSKNSHIRVVKTNCVNYLLGNGDPNMRITNEELLQIIKEELEAVIDEKKGKKRKAAKKKRRKRKKRKKAAKKDACYHKVKARYSVWPSAYASGALVKCRKVGAKNWGNSTKEGLSESKDEFKPHMMYDPKSDKSEMANKKADHDRLAAKGYVHVDPDDLRDILDDEGGAAGLKPMVKGTKSSDKEVKAALKNMPDVGKHEKGDYIKGDDKEVDIVKESESFSVDKKFMTKYLKLKGYKNLEGKDIEQLYTQSLASRGINAPTAKDREKMKGLQEKKNCGCGQNPCKTYGRQ